VLDLSWTLRAIPDVRFGRYDYGGLFVRMPFRRESGGEVLTSNGAHTQSQCEHQRAEHRRAKWVAIAMPIEGRAGKAGLAVMDHPSNNQHPLPWRVDHELGIGPGRCIVGDWSLTKGQSITFRHRLLGFVGPIDSTTIDRVYKHWEHE
jgi:Methane oxygenase PmoA